MRPSAWAIVVLIIVVLLLFGANKLPEIAGSIGKSMKVFKREVKELRDDDASAAGTPPGAGTTGTAGNGTAGAAGTGTTNATSSDQPPPGGSSTPPGA